MIVGALPGLYQSVVLKISIPQIGPDGCDLGWNDEVALLNEPRPFLPKVGDKFGIRADCAHNAHLVGDGLADELSKGLIVVVDTRIHGVIGNVREPAQPDRPEYFLIGTVGRYRILPGLLENLRMSGIVIRNILGPSRYIQPQRDSMMLVNDQATFAG